MPNDSGEDQLVHSYLTLRRLMGLLAISLPVILLVWGSIEAGELFVRESISDYYKFTGEDRHGDAFVGIIITIAWFLIAYRGYTDDPVEIPVVSRLLNVVGIKVTDHVLGVLGGVFALGVALFPHRGGDLDSTVHFVSATSLFIILAVFSLFAFTKSGGDITHQKRARNRIYTGCGIVMVACILLSGIYFARFEETRLAGYEPIFWLETTALWAFGTSWLIKGNALRTLTMLPAWLPVDRVIYRLHEEAEPARP